ncbi:hypothetical protein M5L63_00028540, partial [Klebsiella pneumoniae]
QMQPLRLYQHLAANDNNKISLRDVNNVEVKNVLMTLENMCNAWADVSEYARAPADANHAASSLAAHR